MHARSLRLPAFLVLLAAAALTGPAVAAPDEITLFSEPDFQGRSFTTRDDLEDVPAKAGFAPRSAKVTGHWDICGAVEFTNPCTVLRRDTPNFDYVPEKVGAPTFEVMSLFATYRGVDQPAAAGPPMLELYERAEFMGARVTVTEATATLQAPGLAGRPLSAHVTGRWQLCEGVGFTGRCAIVEGEHLRFSDAELPAAVRSARPAP
ncbi:beta/gamma crystallin-related protein [Phenylobacterium sp. VNQ135]|uniref:beta/gamma crystallin-related protein n=1 Tax=Phenylobacterium sp. VNQ135 TaxID=3400922 RepID=UPI003C004838